MSSHKNLRVKRPVTKLSLQGSSSLNGWTKTTQGLFTYIFHGSPTFEKNHHILSSVYMIPLNEVVYALKV